MPSQGGCCDATLVLRVWVLRQLRQMPQYWHARRLATATTTATFANDPFEACSDCCGVAKRLLHYRTSVSDKHSVAI